MVTGLDLVELQLRIACGQELPLGQEEVDFNGWAMEARICAEDPKRDFMPSTGMISRYAEPRGADVRVDSGVGIGSAVGIYYDSMLAKVICHGQDRDAARLGLVEALNGYHIEGVVTNVDFVNRILCHQRFAQGDLFTGFIGEHFEAGLPIEPQEGRYLELAALAATVLYHVRTAALRDSLEPMISRIGGSKDRQETCSYMVRAETDIFDVELEGAPRGRRWELEARVNGQRHQVQTPPFEFYRRRLKLWIDGQVHRFRMRGEESFFFVSFCGIARLFEVYTPKEWRMMQYMPSSRDQGMENVLACPMPGQVVEVLVKKGDRVFRGQTLVILESMKMESGVASPVDGVVAAVHAVAGKTVEADEILVQFE
jgi:propionyl-CoA carboxylase alpha chain